MCVCIRHRALRDGVCVKSAFRIRTSISTSTSHSHFALRLRIRCGVCFVLNVCLGSSGLAKCSVPCCPNSYCSCSVDCSFRVHAFSLVFRTDTRSASSFPTSIEAVLCLRIDSDSHGSRSGMLGSLAPYQDCQGRVFCSDARVGLVVAITLRHDLGEPFLRGVEEPTANTAIPFVFALPLRSFSSLRRSVTHFTVGLTTMKWKTQAIAALSFTQSFIGGRQVKINSSRKQALPQKACRAMWRAAIVA